MATVFIVNEPMDPDPSNPGQLKRKKNLRPASAFGDLKFLLPAGHVPADPEALAAARGPADGVIEAIGDVALAGPLLKLIKPGGFASAYGAPEDGKAYPPGWTTASVEEHRAYAWVADLLLRGWVRPEWFVTHTWPFSEARQAFERVREGGVIKGLILMS